MKNAEFGVLVLLCFLLGACTPPQDMEKLDAFSEGQLRKWNHKLSDVIIADIFTPPVSSRIYAYTNIAAYEALHAFDSSTLSFAGSLNGFSTSPLPTEGEEYYAPLSGIVAFTTAASQLVYNSDRIKELETEYLAEIKKTGIKGDVFNRSVAYGREVGSHVMSWANQDGYNQRTSRIKYTVNKDPGRWRPTPPDYMEGIEPHWNTVRPFTLDSASQFSPGAPTSFDTIKGSVFYQETMQVYEAVKTIDDEKLNIAKFWDCNPNISYTQGHVMYFHQQISPGGHWIHIECQVTEAEKLSEMESAYTLSKVAIAIADAFISCWDEKYRSSLVRPETYINRYIDKDWEPILQTPAFPEHTSGHSVASSSAAVMLTHLFGNTYSFIDSTEVPFGLPARPFTSFYQASEEAAISRLYGGIHYLPAVTKGVEQGKKVGEFVFKKLPQN